MNYNTVYVGMDVHKESFSLCAYTIEAEKASHYQRTEADYKKVLNYLEFLRTIYGDDANFICGYEAGCFGYTLYHQLTANNVKCIILAPTTMLEQRSKKRIKTDRRDAEIIAKCLAQHNYSPVHIPTAKDEETKEFLRMRDDHKLALKKVKQQILAFCLRHNYRYDGKSHWTAAHLKWLKALTPEALYKEILDEYLLTYQTLSDKIERLDKRIEELATQDEYKEAVKKLCCFIGVKTHTALSVLVEVGDFKRFASAQHFASYLGLVPGEFIQIRIRLTVTQYCLKQWFNIVARSLHIILNDAFTCNTVKNREIQLFISCVQIKEQFVDLIYDFLGTLIFFIDLINQKNRF